MLLSDRMIRTRAEQDGMITPFHDHQVIRLTDEAAEYVPRKLISSGLSSAGYDLTCGNHFKIFDPVTTAVVDPKAEVQNWYRDLYIPDHEAVTIPPNSFALTHAKERLNLPRHILALIIGKSTYARCGIIANITPGEPEWEGVLTLELSNTTPLPARVYAGEGIVQALFLQVAGGVEVSYADRKGKYQGQVGITLPKVV